MILGICGLSFGALEAYVSGPDTPALFRAISVVPQLRSHACHERADLAGLWWIGSVSARVRTLVVAALQLGFRRSIRVGEVRR